MLVYLQAADIARSGQRILDVGTKDGRHYAENEAEAVGVDIDPQKPVRDIEMCQADGGRLPFRDDAFDIVVSNQVYEHLTPELRIAVTREVARVLAPDGVFLVSFSNRLFPFGNHGIGIPGFQYLPSRVRNWLADLVLSEEHRRYHRDRLFYVSPISVRPIMEVHFDDVEYITPTLGVRYGPDVWPEPVTRAWPLIVSTAVGRTLVEFFFGYAAYACRSPADSQIN